MVVQSMTNAPGADAGAVLRQVRRLASGGAELVRVSIPDDASADALALVVEGSPVPIIADIHFRADLAIRALEAGAAKLRLNPGNIRRRADVERIASEAAARRAPIRVGINSGSVPGDLASRYGGVNADSMWAAAERHVAMLEAVGFEDIVISLKASDPLLTVEACSRASRERRYPLHIGVTEAGPVVTGAVRSAVAATLLLSRGIGDTIRVSLSGPPENELPAAWEILGALGLRRGRPRIISCPTCARTRIDVAGLARRVERMLAAVRGDFTVAVMGCEVNGPGEAKEADLAVIGTPSGVVFYSGGRRVPGTVPAKDLARRLREEIAAAARRGGGRS